MTGPVPGSEGIDGRRQAKPDLDYYRRRNKVAAGLCVSVEGPTDSNLGGAPCVDNWRQRFIAQTVGSQVRFRLNGTSTCLEVAPQSSGGIHALSLNTCGLTSAQLWEYSCFEHWKNPATGAVLYIQPTSTTTGVSYGLSGYSGYCTDPLSLITPVPLVTASVISPLSNNQSIQLRGSASGPGPCINVTGASDTDISAETCANSWRQRFIAQQSGHRWRFKVNGTNDCLEPGSQPSGGTYPLKIAACGAATQWFERQCVEGWKNPVTNISLVMNAGTAVGKVLASPCSESGTAIAPIAWVQ